ncbi:hypothetical protein [Paraglaciecola sp. 25GB23A]|uniref:hypothetical protein n=1 Tax=Paraglaciecola sp. 25GB23A TaxID=3156068 RepID=UPI0032AEFD69
MSVNRDKKSQFVKVYKRASQSPFSDHSTMLWLASAICENDLGIEIDYKRYIYVHREIDGTICGISISKKMLSENPDFENRYLDGVEMYAFLLIHIEEITAFCEFFRNEFIDMFLIPPLTYFTYAEQYWLEKISDA